MDDIFEQMLLTSPWGDGVGMNRAGWDAGAGSAGNNTRIDLSQSLSKAPSMASNLLGSLGNQEVSGALLQDSNGRVRHGGHHAPHLLQQPWNFGGLPPGPSALNRVRSGSFLLQGEEGIRRDFDDDMLLEGHPDNMNVGLQPGQAAGYGDQGALNEDPAGTSPINGALKLPRVRARRGQATDPHSIAERNRRERIAERMRALQELVPDSNKTDKASMLDEIIGYVKFLQMQVKCLSMCRLGGAGAAAVPLLADLPVEGAAGNFLAAANLAQAHHAGLGASTQAEGMAQAERQVAQLMDEDMSAAMQYLQSKGLCLMPISLATAISSSGARQPAATPPKAGQAAMEAAAAAAAAAISKDGGSSNAAKESQGKTGGLIPNTANQVQDDDNMG